MIEDKNMLFLCIFANYSLLTKLKMRKILIISTTFCKKPPISVLRLSNILEHFGTQIANFFFFQLFSLSFIFIIFATYSTPGSLW